MSSESGAAGVRCSPASILVIDDDDTLRVVLARVLAREGYEVLVAEDGSRGIQVFHDNPTVSLVVLDWKMPGMTGDEVLDWLHAARPDLKVVVSSACLPAEVAERFAGRRVTEFIQKPFAARIFVERVRSILAA